MKLLLVEDSYDLAEVMREALSLDQYTVNHAVSIETAMAELGSGYLPDGAVLDVNVGGSTVFEVADHLDAAGIPFLFASGAGRDEIPYRFSAKLLLRKPFALGSLLDALRHMLRDVTRRSRTGEAADGSA